MNALTPTSRIVTTIGMLLWFVVPAFAQVDRLDGKTIKFSHRYANCESSRSSIQKVMPIWPGFSGTIYFGRQKRVYLIYSDTPDAGVLAVMNAGPTSGVTVLTSTETNKKRRVPVVAEARFDGQDFTFSYSYTENAPWGPRGRRSFDDTSTSLHFDIDADMTCHIVGSSLTKKVSIERLIIWRGYTCGPEVVSDSSCRIVDDEPMSAPNP